MQLRHAGRFKYGDSLRVDNRLDGDVLVYGSNGPVGRHNISNTGSPVVVVGRKGSHGKLQYSPRPVFAIDTTYYIDGSCTDANIKWLYYALSTVGLEMLGQDVGVPGLNREQAYSQRIPLPNHREQRAIADYLDIETGRIDALIAKKRRMIELLSERWIAKVRRAMSESTQTRVALRHICTVKRGQSPRPIHDPRYFDDAGSHGWVRIEDVTREGMYLTNTRQRLSDVGRARSVAVGPGMVLVSIAATVGKPAITAMKCCYHDGFVGLHHLRAVPEYVYFLLTLPEVFAGLGQVGTQVNINSEIVGRVKIPLPPHDEQQRIVKRLMTELRRTQAVKSRLSTQLDLLLERRQALVTAAVTGELSIPGVAA